MSFLTLSLSILITFFGITTSSSSYGKDLNKVTEKETTTGAGNFQKNCSEGFHYDDFHHACVPNEESDDKEKDKKYPSPNQSLSPVYKPPTVTPGNTTTGNGELDKNTTPIVVTTPTVGAVTKVSHYSSHLKENAKKMDPFKDVFNNNIQVPSAFQNTTLTQDQMINLRNCFHGVDGYSCQAGKLSVYPQVSVSCGADGKCNGEKVKIEGCYTQNFHRGVGTDGEIPPGLNGPGTGKCGSQAFPFRIMVTGKTGCSNGTSCTKGSYIDVTIQIFDDLIPEQSVEFSALTKITTRVSSQATGDPLRVSCAMLAPDGYEWDDEVGKCVRPTQNVCEMLNLPFVKETNSKKKSKSTTINPHGHCVAQNIDCKSAFPTQNICTDDQKHCKGSRYPMKSAGDVACLCTGTSTTLDGVKRACFSDAGNSDGKNLKAQEVKSFSVLLFENPSVEYNRSSNNDVWSIFSGEKITNIPSAVTKEGPDP